MGCTFGGSECEIGCALGLGDSRGEIPVSRFLDMAVSFSCDEFQVAGFKIPVANAEAVRGHKPSNDTVFAPWKGWVCEF